MSNIISTLQINKEYRSLVSRLTKEEYDSLKKSNKEYGQQLPIIINREGVILDGNHRFRVCEELGISSKTEIKHFEDKLHEKLFVIDTILERRQLYKFQRIELALVREPIVKEIAKRNQLSGLKKADSSLVEQNLVQQDKFSHSGINRKIGKSAKALHESVRQVKMILKKGSEELKEQLRADKIKINRAFKTIKNEEIRKQLLEEAANTPFPTTNFIEKSTEIPDNSVDLIFTDLPYAGESLPIYGDLAKVAMRVLKPAGSLVIYVGQYFIPEFIDLVTDVGLTYWWEFGVKYPPGHEPIFKKHVFHEWKPLFWFIKGDKLNEGLPFISDFVETKHPNKDLHIWAQCPIEAKHITEKLTVENQVVFDPMMGSGTTGIVAAGLNRKFIDIEVDEGHFKIAQLRIDKAACNRASYSSNVNTSGLQCANDHNRILIKNDAS